MKAVENYINTAIKDAKTVIPALLNAKQKLGEQYTESSHPKLRILDCLIWMCLSVFFSNIVYMFAVGTKEPYNALLAASFCSLGQFALAGKFITFLIFYF
jgi:hypothetical protein